MNLLKSLFLCVLILWTSQAFTSFEDDYEPALMRYKEYIEKHPDTDFSENTITFNPYEAEFDSCDKRKLLRNLSLTETNKEIYLNTWERLFSQENLILQYDLYEKKKKKNRYIHIPQKYKITHWTLAWSEKTPEPESLYYLYKYGQFGEHTFFERPDNHHRFVLAYTITITPSNLQKIMREQEIVEDNGESIILLDSSSDNDNLLYNDNIIVEDGGDAVLSLSESDSDNHIDNEDNGLLPHQHNHSSDESDACSCFFSCFGCSGCCKLKPPSHKYTFRVHLKPLKHKKYKTKKHKKHRH